MSTPISFIRESSGEYRSKCGRFQIDKRHNQWDVSYKGRVIAKESGYPEAEKAALDYQPDLVAEINVFTEEVKALREPQEGVVDALEALRHAAVHAMIRLNDKAIAALPFKAGGMVVHKISQDRAKLSFIHSIRSNPYNVSRIRIEICPATKQKQASKVNIRDHDIDKEINFLRHLRDDDAPVWDGKKNLWLLPW